MPDALASLLLLTLVTHAQEEDTAPPPSRESTDVSAPVGDQESDADAAPASAASGPDVADPIAVDGEVIVFGDLQVAARRAELESQLRRQGYRTGDRRDGHTVYRPEDAWKPTVIVYDDGFIRLKRSPVRFEPPGYKPGANKLRYLWCLPPFTPMCLRVGGRVVSRAKLEPQKARVVQATHPQVDAWREALVGRAMEDKIGRALPDRLDQLWSEGRPLEGEGPVLETPETRRAAMLDHWSSRTCTPEGDAVAEVVALFLEYEVQSSGHPVTAAEQDRANASQACSRRLDLTRPTHLDGADTTF